MIWLSLSPVTSISESHHLMKTILISLAASTLCLSGNLLAQNRAPSPQADLQDALQQIELGKLPAGWKALKGDWGVRLDQQFAPEGSVEAKQPLPLIPALEKESLLPRVSQKMLPRV